MRRAYDYWQDQPDCYPSLPTLRKTKEPSEQEGALLVRTLGVVGSRSLIKDSDLMATLLMKELPPLTPRTGSRLTPETRRRRGCSFRPFGFSPALATHKGPHCDARPFGKGEPARTTLPRQHYSAECTATFARAQERTGSQCGLSLRSVLELNDIKLITIQISPQPQTKFPETGC